MGHALPSSEVLTAGTSPPTPQERRFFPRCCWDVHVCLGGGTSSRLLPTCSRPRCASLCSVSDPQEAQLDAEVCSVSDAREEVLCVTGSAGRHAGSIRHRVIVDVFGQDAAALQQDSATGDGLGVSTTTVSRHACVCVSVRVERCYVVWVDTHLLARRMLTCGVEDSGSGTQSGWIRLKASA